MTCLILLVQTQAPLAPQPAPTKTVPVTGTVVDDERKPVAGAEVFLTGFKTSGGWPPLLGRVRTDEAGRFHLEAPADPDDPSAPGAGALWAYRPGTLVAARGIRPRTFVPDLAVEFVLGPPSRSVFEVLGPDGKPVAGATVIPRVIDRDASAAPDALGARVAAKTDAQGRAIITAFFPEEIATVAVTAPGLGTQHVVLRAGETGKKTITLWPVGQLRGRVVSEDPKSVSGLSVTVVSFNPRQPAPAAGYFSVTTDAQGRFEVPEIPEGRLGVSIPPRAGAPWSGRLASPAQVEAGKTTEVIVRMKRCARVVGVVRERDTHQPIPGAAVSLGLDLEPVRTDAQGRYEGYVLPGRLFLHLWSAPKPYASLVFGLPEPNIPAGVAEHELPPITLARAGSVHGRVLDDDGHPVTSACVRASWGVNEGPMRQGKRDVEALTDRRGEFRFDGAPLDGVILLSARFRNQRTDRPVPARANAGAPVTLHLDSARSVALSGRVLGADGKPVAGARVRIRSRHRSETGKVEGRSLVDFDGLYTLRTDSTGHFQTPPHLAGDEEYFALAEAEGYQTGHSSWVAGKAGRFADIILQPEMTAVSAEGRLAKPAEPRRTESE